MTIGLAIIDVQKAFLSPDKLAGIHHAATSLHIINGCSAAFRAAGQPVFRVYDAGAGQRDDMDYEFLDQVVPAGSDIIVHKEHGNAFNSTPMLEQVKDLGIELMLLCGYRSENCVLDTAMGARDLGIPLGVIRDAHLTPDRKAFEAVEKLLPTVSHQLVAAMVGGFAART